MPQEIQNEKLVNLEDAQVLYNDLRGRADSKVSSNQGVENAGKALGIDVDGLVVPTPFPVFDYTSRSAFPATGAAAKIYVAKDTGFLYTWNGTTYVTLVDDASAATNKVWSASKVSGELTDLEETVTESMEDLEENLNAEISRLDGVKAESDNLYAYKTAVPGEVVECYDAVAEAVKTMQIEIAPVQDLHGYDNPWPAGGGKNKLPLPVATTQDGITLVRNDDGSVTLTGTAERTTYFDCFAGTFDSTAFAGYKIIVYATSGAISSSNLRIRISDSSRISIQEIISAETEATIADNGSGLYLAIRVPNGFAIPSGGYTLKPMLYAPNESSTFVPYSNICPISGFTGCDVTVANGDDPTAQGYAITFPSSAGTVYGGTLTVNKDGTGELMVDRQFFDLTGKTFSTTSVVGRFLFSTSANDMPKTAGQGKYIVSSHFPSVRQMSSIGVKCFINSDIQILFQTGDVSIDTVEKLNTWLTAQSNAGTPVTCCYELATPVTYTLTAPQIRTILGYNRIYASTGSILSMLYPAERYLTAEQADKERIHAVVDEQSAVMSVTDGADNVPMGMQIAIEPVQDLHGYDNPWPAGGGANQWDEVWEQGGVNISDGQNYANESPRIRSKNYISVNPGAEYYISYLSGISHVIAFYDSNKSFISGAWTSDGIITVPNNAYFIRFSTNDDYGATYKNNISINYPATVTTYSPYSNICPVTGWTGAEVTRTGKNLLKLFDTDSTHRGVHITKENGVVKRVGTWDSTNTVSGFSITGTTISLGNYSNYYNTTEDNTIKLKPGTYTLTAKATKSTNASTLQVFCATFRSLGGNIANGIGMIGSTYGDIINQTKTYSFTLTEEAYFYCGINSAVSSDGTAVDWAIEVQLEVGNSASAFVPYIGSTTEYAFPEAAGTVYGGTLAVNKDGSGKLIATHERINLGSVSWDYNSTYSFFHTNAIPAKAVDTGYIPDWKCECYKIISVRATSSWGSAENNSISERGDGRVCIKDTRYTDGTSLGSALNGIYLVYELATPVEYTLTAEQITSLLGLNNIWADCGNVLQLDYAADTKTYIDNQTADISGKVATAIGGLKSEILLQEETIPDTTQTISFDSSGNVSSIVHKDGTNNTIRSDVFTFGTNTITEVRTLYTGETLTIVTNTTTLVTTVTYAAA